MVASCDIPVQVWMLFSTAPNLQGLFWKGIGPSGSFAPCCSISIRPTALRHIIHCLPLITVWKYQGQGSCIPLGASVGVLALCACMCATVSNVQNVPHMRDWGIKGSAEFHSTFFPLAHHVLHTLDLPQDPVSTRFRSANGWLGASGKVRVVALIVSV